MKECRRCLLEELEREDILGAIREKIEKLPGKDRAEEEVYRSRLEACRSCDFLVSGICLKCGCYVEFRAAFKRMKCPNPAARKW